MHRRGVQGSMEAVRREAWATLIKTAQTHYPAGVSKLEEAVVHGIKVTNLRLASHTARELYGTKHLPILGVDDPIRTKFIRRAHTTDSTGSRGTHQFGKTTLANLMSGEMGIIWERCKADGQTYKRLCGICRRSSKEKCCPSLGDTLFRTGP